MRGDESRVGIDSRLAPAAALGVLLALGCATNSGSVRIENNSELALEARKSGQAKAVSIAPGKARIAVGSDVELTLKDAAPKTSAPEAPPASPDAPTPQEPHDAETPSSDAARGGAR